MIRQPISSRAIARTGTLVMLLAAVLGVPGCGGGDDTHGGLSASDVERAVVPSAVLGENASDFDYKCEHAGGSSWRCEVKHNLPLIPDPEAQFDVVFSSERCWTATQTNADSFRGTGWTPSKVQGCNARHASDPTFDLSQLEASLGLTGHAMGDNVGCNSDNGTARAVESCTLWTSSSRSWDYVVVSSGSCWKATLFGVKEMLSDANETYRQGLDYSFTSTRRELEHERDEEKRLIASQRHLEACI